MGRRSHVECIAADFESRPDDDLAVITNAVQTGRMPGAATLRFSHAQAIRSANEKPGTRPGLRWVLEPI